LSTKEKGIRIAGALAITMVTHYFWNTWFAQQSWFWDWWMASFG
jgi:hypothetical protein